MVLGQWDEARHRALETELTELVSDHWAQAIEKGSAHRGPRLDSALLFEDVYREVPDHLRLQREELRRLEGGA